MIPVTKLNNGIKPIHLQFESLCYCATHYMIKLLFRNGGRQQGTIRSQLRKKTTHIPLTFHILAVRMKLTQKFRTEGSEQAQESILEREKKRKTRSFTIRNIITVLLMSKRAETNLRNRKD